MKNASWWPQFDCPTFVHSTLIRWSLDKSNETQRRKEGIFEKIYTSVVDMYLPLVVPGTEPSAVLSGFESSPRMLDHGSDRQSQYDSC